MSDLLTELTAAAVAVYRARVSETSTYSSSLYNEALLASDPVLRSVQKAAFLYPEIERTIEPLIAMIASDPEFSVIASRAGELDVFIIHPAGGFRSSPSSIIVSLFSNALSQLYLTRSALSEGSFVRQVLDNLEELRRALRGEHIRANWVHGVAGISLPEGVQISTPWGVLRPAPPEENVLRAILPWQLQASCILDESKLVRIGFDRAAEPKMVHDPKEAQPSAANLLLPLACALASPDANAPIVPILAWSTILMPFGLGSSYGTNQFPPRYRPTKDAAAAKAEIEEWARTVDQYHVATVDIAAHRLVSACAHRLDPADALIDAVMVWENLVGTSTETTFRVTAALAKSLESEASKRRDLRRSLGKIYDVRSKVVHGVAIDAPDVNAASERATEVALLALRAAYRRGKAWLQRGSTERADILLLEDE
jgi:hypothetical protein